jgi:hypothetical protein
MSGERTRAACLADAMFPRVSRPVDVTDETLFPNIAEASRWYASLSPERKAELEKEWNDG